MSAIHPRTSPRLDLRSPDGRFDLAAWRDAVTAAATMCSSTEALAPFGFEVTRDPSFLRRDLRRFYVYVSVAQSSTSMETCAEQYADQLLTILAERHPLFYSTVDAIIMPHRTVRLGSGSLERAVYLFARPRADDLLTEWARYVLAAGESLTQAALPEVRRFDSHRFARAYVFQLAVMFGHLWQVDPADGAWIREAGRFAAPRAATGERDSLLEKDSPATEEETTVFQTLVLPRMRAMIEQICLPSGDPGAERVVVTDFHSPQRLESWFRPVALADLTARLVDRYLTYPERQW